MREPAAWQQFLAKNAAEKTAILYCRTGSRAGQVVQLMAREGLSVLNMGGLREWARAGLGVESFGR